MMVRRWSRNTHQRGINIDIEFAGCSRFFLRINFILQELVKSMNLFAVLVGGLQGFHQRMQPARGQFVVHVPQQLQQMPRYVIPRQTRKEKLVE